MVFRNAIACLRFYTHFRIAGFCSLYFERFIYSLSIRHYTNFYDQKWYKWHYLLTRTLSGLYTCVSKSRSPLLYVQLPRQIITLKSLPMVKQISVRKFDDIIDILTFNKLVDGHWLRKTGGILQGTCAGADVYRVLNSERKQERFRCSTASLVTAPEIATRTGL